MQLQLAFSQGLLKPGLNAPEIELTKKENINNVVSSLFFYCPGKKEEFTIKTQHFLQHQCYIARKTIVIIIIYDKTNEQ